MTVYRGVQNKTHIMPHPNSIISTSNDAEVAVTFTKDGGYDKPRCCLLEITIPPGSHVLPIYSISSAEYEQVV